MANGGLPDGGLDVLRRIEVEAMAAAARSAADLVVALEELRAADARLAAGWDREAAATLDAYRAAEERVMDAVEAHDAWSAFTPSGWWR